MAQSANRPPVQVRSNGCDPGSELPLVGVSSERACLVERDNWLHILVSDKRSGQALALLPLEREQILGFLASTRLEPVWPRLMEFVGEDGSGLREALRRRAVAIRQGGNATAGRNSPLDHFNSGSTLSTMRASIFLADAGDFDEAYALLEARIARLEALERLSDDQQFDLLSLMLQRGQITRRRLDNSALIGIYQQIERHPRISAAYRLNAMVNRAATLAEAGEAQAALELVNRAQEQFNESRSLNVPGSDRQFAWIRACALKQLGELEAASRQFDLVEAASPEFRGAVGTIASTESIVLRAAFCMDDDELLARELRGTGRELLERGALLFQRGLAWPDTRRPAAIERVRGRFAARGHMQAIRELPDSLIPALNRWQTPAAVAE